MKYIRVYMIIFILNIAAEFFLSFYFLSENLSNPVKNKEIYPFKSFPIYQLQPNGEVTVNFMNIIYSSLLLAIPFTFILLFISGVVRKQLDSKGRI